MQILPVTSSTFAWLCKCTVLPVTSLPTTDILLFLVIRMVLVNLSGILSFVSVYQV